MTGDEQSGSTGLGFEDSAPRRLRSRLGSGIAFRLLLFNLLLVFLPVAGFIALDVFERQLLEAQERSMVQQGRVLAAALSHRGPLDRDAARQILEALGDKVTARLRILDREARLLADSSHYGPLLDQPPGRGEGTARDEDVSAPARRSTESTARSSPLYRLGASAFRLLRHFASRPLPAGSPDPYASDRPFDGPEIAAAIAGRYGAATRVTSGRGFGERSSMILYSAIPIRDGERVVGAVLVSQSTLRVLAQLAEVRLDVFQVFLLSLLAASVLSLMMAATIVRPLHRLRREAATLLDRRGRLRGRFTGSRRRDEIGSLARALERLSQRLEEQLRFNEAFAGDLAHELKNPLASIRAASEMLEEADSEMQRQRFITLIEREVHRAERLLGSLRDLTVADLDLEEESAERIDLVALTRGVVEGFRVRAGERAQIELRHDADPLLVVGSAQRFTQVIENLLDNALGFSPPGGRIEVALEASSGTTTLRVSDQGPGIPPEHRQRVFERFFSYRPAQPGHRPEEPGRGEHLGLGLSLVKTVVESYGGTVSAGDGEGGGAVLVVRLPLAHAAAF